MAIEQFFDHQCDIYHLRETKIDLGYTLPEQVEFSYPDMPDEESIPCHFGVGSFSHSFTQSQPMNELDVLVKLTLPAGTDIRVNDKIVEKTTGYAYTAQTPRNIRGHHIFVFCKRTREQKPL